MHFPLFTRAPLFDGAPPPLFPYTPLMLFRRGVTTGEVDPYLIDEVTGVVFPQLEQLTFGPNEALDGRTVTNNNNYGETFMALAVNNAVSGATYVKAVRMTNFGCHFVPGQVNIPVSLGAGRAAVNLGTGRIFAFAGDTGTDDEYKLVACDIVSNALVQTGSTFTANANGGGIGIFTPMNMWVDASGDVICVLTRDDDPYVTYCRAYRFNGSTFSLVHSLDIAIRAQADGRVLNFSNCFTIQGDEDLDYLLNVYTYSSSTGFALDFVYNPAALYSGTKTGMRYWRDQRTDVLCIAPESNSVPADDVYYRTIDLATNSLTVVGQALNVGDADKLTGQLVGTRDLWRDLPSTTRKVSSWSASGSTVLAGSTSGAPDGLWWMTPVVDGGLDFQSFDRNFSSNRAVHGTYYVTDDQLGVTGASGTYANSRGTRACKGKCYFAFDLTHTDAGAVLGAGVVDSSVNLVANNAWVGNNTLGLSVSSPNGVVYANGGSVGSAGSLSNPDAVEIAVDVDTRRVWVRQSGGGWVGGGNPATNTTPTYTLSGTGNIYPAAWISTTGTQATRTARLLTTAGVTPGVVPAGFTAANWI